MKVMIVEDEVIAALATQKMLQKLGFEVCGNVTTGEDALAAVDDGCPDLVIMDVYLDGELDGIETAERLQQLRDVPVIYVTAYSDDATRARASATHPLAYLVKPLDMSLLEKALEGLTRPTTHT
jgi:CheY-like chemotaxis protein